MIEVTLHNPAPCGEAVCGFLEQHDIQPVVQEGFSEAGTRVTFYLGEDQWDAFRGLFSEKLREIYSDLGISAPVVTAKVLEKEHWQDAWKEYAKIYRFGKDLIVKPTWRTLRTPPACPVISIDPQMAFGTGGHASTRLCLRFLISLKKTRPACLNRVLDVGTGSGILAIAAAHLGAKQVVALDIDPDAMIIARKNARKNGVADRIQFFRGSIQAVGGFYSLILANIALPVLTELLEAFASLLDPEGVLVTSGLLREQGEQFLKEASQVGLKRRSRRVLGEWVSYALELRVSES